MHDICGSRVGWLEEPRAVTAKIACGYIELYAYHIALSDAFPKRVVFYAEAARGDFAFCSFRATSWEVENRLPCFLLE